MQTHFRTLHKTLHGQSDIQTTSKLVDSEQYLVLEF